MIVCECIDQTHILSGQYSHDCIMNGYEFMMLLSLLMMLMKFVTTGVGNRSGGYSRKQVKQTLSLSLNSELTYSEMGNSEYPVPEQRIWVSSINSEYVNLELRACTTTIKSHHQWSPDTTSHHDNRKKKDQHISVRWSCDGRTLLPESTRKFECLAYSYEYK